MILSILYNVYSVPYNGILSDSPSRCDNSAMAISSYIGFPYKFCAPKISFSHNSQHNFFYFSKFIRSERQKTQTVLKSSRRRQLQLRSKRRRQLWGQKTEIVLRSKRQRQFQGQKGGDNSRAQKTETVLKSKRRIQFQGSKD